VNRKEIVLRRRTGYLTLQNACARGRRPERQAYVQHKLTNIIPNLNRALQKLDEGTGRVCDDCGDDIPQERIEAVPAAIRCTRCQDAHERHGRRQ
jgi:RNA polymerase-binding transcription factor DksA